MTRADPEAIVLMGVSGSGKSTVGRALADILGRPFYDADDYHPQANVDKMARGEPLTDADRAPWLARLHALLAASLEREEAAVLACSALKRAYRDRLGRGLNVTFVYLRGTYDLIWARMAAREDHFMEPEMLRSQFEALEEPAEDEALWVDVDQDVASIVAYILSALV